MKSPAQFKSGIVIKVDNKLYSIISYQHTKPGKGPAYFRTKLKNIQNNSIIEKSFRSDEKVEDVFLHEKKLIYLYHDENTYHFMDQSTYEQLSINKKEFHHISDYLKDNTEVTVTFGDGKIIAVNLPNFIELKIKYTEPSIKGNTAKNTITKTAIIETGAKVQVPIFIKEGDKIRLDTRTKQYAGKVK